MHLSSQRTRSFYSFFQPAIAWIAIIGFAGFSTLCAFAGLSKVLNLIFPIGAVAVGLLLYFRAPLLYIGFTWWLWFLSPLIRRYIDYRSIYTEPSLIILTPFLVTLITLITVFQNIPKAKQQESLPFILTLLGVLYGYLVGALLASPVSATTKVLEWLAPVTFSFHLFVNWREYPSYRQTTQRIFLWCVLITGAYGIYQFMVAPEWDTTWMLNLEERAVTFGLPEPFGIRVWSTMHGPLVFASVMAAGLILLTTNTGSLSFLAIMLGFLTLLLSMVRTAWLGWLFGMFDLLVFLKPKFQMRLILFVVILALCLIPLINLEPFSDVINARIQTLTDLSNDTSASDRQGAYASQIGTALTNVLGDGIGGRFANQVFDSAILESFFTLGLFGGAFYLGGMASLLSRLIGNFRTSTDVFLNAARAITISIVVQMPLGSVIRGLPGVVLWGFLGIGLAAQKYHQDQSLQNALTHTDPYSN